MPALLISALVFLAVYFIVVAALTSNRQTIRDRLHDYNSAGNLTFFERDSAELLLAKVFLHILRRLASYIGAIAPDRVAEETKRRLQLAGYPLNLGVNGFLMIKAGMLVLLPIAYGTYLFLNSKGGATPLQWGVLLCLFYTGFRLPNWWLDRRITARQQEINQALPDALDFIIICSEAGLAFEAAMARMAERMKGPLADEMRRSLGEISLGKRRRDALRDLVNRTQASDLTSFIASVVQADQTGISIGNILRVQAEDLRLKRRQRAELQGREAPLKMLVPLIFFIFPATFLVVIGPASLQIIDFMLSNG